MSTRSVKTTNRKAAMSAPKKAAVPDKDMVLIAKAELGAMRAELRDLRARTLPSLRLSYSVDVKPLSGFVLESTGASGTTTPTKARKSPSNTLADAPDEPEPSFPEPA